MVSFEQMKDQLYTVDEVKEKLAQTEPLAQLPLTVGSSRFFLEASWNHAAETLEGTDRVAATAVLNGQEVPLTKDALLGATSFCGLPKAYVLRTPARLIEDQLNYWYGTGLDKELQMLTVRGLGAAVTRATVKPFSNLRLLEGVLSGIENKFGKGDVYVDRKFDHALPETQLRLVIPSSTFTVRDTGVDDDEWSLGINLRNSLTGSDQTWLDGYLFRWWCTNGAIDRHATSGKWSRKSGGQDEETVYEWARGAVDDVLGSLDSAFDSLQEMAHLPMGSDASQIMRDLFENFKISIKDREVITSNLTNSGSLTAYSLMNAVTAAANLPERSPRDRQALMRAGGELRHALADRCGSCHRVLN